MPNSRRWSAGLTPDSMRICGEAMAPLLTMISSPSTDKSLPAAFRFNAHGPLALEHHPAYSDVAPDCEVEPVSNRVEVGYGRAHPHAIDIIQRAGRNAAGIGVILVRVLPEAQVYAGVIKRSCVGKPLLPLVAPYRNGPVAPVKVIARVIQVGLQLPEVGQHLQDRPTRRCPRLPSCRSLRVHPGKGPGR